MADEDAGRAVREESEDDAGFSFSLPPIKLPEMELPERIRLAFPIPDPPEKVQKPTRVRVSWVLVAVLVADTLDALVVVLVDPTALPWARAVAGTAASILLVGLPGLLYAWELVAIFGGPGWLSVAPTLTLLVLARIVFTE